MSGSESECQTTWVISQNGFSLEVIGPLCMIFLLVLVDLLELFDFSPYRFFFMYLRYSITTISQLICKPKHLYHCLLPSFIPLFLTHIKSGSNAKPLVNA